MFEIKAIPEKTNVWNSEDNNQIFLAADKLKACLSWLPYTDYDSSHLSTENSGSTPVATNTINTLFDSLDRIFYNIGIKPYHTSNYTEACFRSYTQYHTHYTTLGRNEFGVRLFVSNRYNAETRFSADAGDYEELKAVALGLQENNKHYVKVIKYENTLFIFTNKFSWDLYFKAKALQYRFFEDKSRTYNKDVIECVLALANRDVATFNRYLNKIINYKTWEKYKYTKFINCFKSSKEERLKNKKDQLTAYANDIQNYEQLLKKSLTQHRNLLEEYNLLLNSEDNFNAEEIVDYLAAHHYIRELEYISNTKLQLNIEAPLLYFDQDLAEEYRVNDPREKFFFEEVFIKRRYKLWTHCSITFNTETFNTTAIRRNGNGNYFPHPHIDRFRCQGNHPDAIKRWINDYDYIGCIEQIMAMVYNLNFTDATVINEMLYQFWEHFTYTKCLENIETGEFISFDDLIKKMPKEETTDETVTPFD